MVLANLHAKSLIIPIIFLVYNETNDILTLLETTSYADKTTLSIFINNWCENAETFQGFWPQRLSTLALMKLFGLGRPSLKGLVVKGDIIVRPETKNGMCVFFHILVSSSLLSLSHPFLWSVMINGFFLFFLDDV